jgi:hypothetical protein
MWQLPGSAGIVSGDVGGRDVDAARSDLEVTGVVRGEDNDDILEVDERITAETMRWGEYYDPPAAVVVDRRSAAPRMSIKKLDRSTDRCARTAAVQNGGVSKQVRKSKMGRSEKGDVHDVVAKSTSR